MCVFHRWQKVIQIWKDINLYLFFLCVLSLLIISYWGWPDCRGKFSGWDCADWFGTDVWLMLRCWSITETKSIMITQEYLQWLFSLILNLLMSLYSETLLLLFSCINHVLNCSTPLFFLYLHISSSERKNNRQTLNPTTTPVTRRREDEAAETGEHDQICSLVTHCMMILQ